MTPLIKYAIQLICNYSLQSSVQLLSTRNLVSRRISKCMHGLSSYPFYNKYIERTHAIECLKSHKTISSKSLKLYVLLKISDRVRNLYVLEVFMFVFFFISSNDEN